MVHGKKISTDEGRNQTNYYGPSTMDYSLYLPPQNHHMSEDLDLILADTEESMTKAISHLETELTKIRAGKANPTMLDGIMVDYYGSPTPINQVANISVLDVRTISIQPWEKNMLAAIERAIMAANIGITPQNDGVQLRLFLPPLTEERRRELVKKAAGEGEHSKVAIRNIRRDAIEQVKKLQKDGLSEDAAKDTEKSIQDITDKFISLVDKHLAAKEKEVMAV
jgi:ribosome recycling factor